MHIGLYLGIATLIIISSLCFMLLSALILIMPDKEKNKINPKLPSKIWNELTENNVKLSIAMLIIAIIAFVFISLISTNSWKEFIEGIHVELFGIVFDVIVFVVLFNWINSHGEKKERINRYKEGIDDFRHWKSDEAKFKIRGNVKRLNNEGITKIDLSYVDISNSNVENQQQLDFSEIKLDNSRLLQSNMSNLNMSKSTFNGMIDHNSKFIESGLLYAEIKNCHLQGTDFTNAFLHGADFSNSTLSSNTNFSNSNLSYANFNNVNIGSANFQGAKVNETFLEEVNNWNIQGNNIFLNYKIVEIPRNNGYDYVLVLK